jgi:hypothetical protein
MHKLGKLKRKRKKGVWGIGNSTEKNSVHYDKMDEIH